jgi:hypothetical protein
MHTIIKVINDGNSGIIPVSERTWCAQIDEIQTVCGLGADKSDGAIYETRVVERGEITCTDCLETIKKINNIKL